MSAKDLEVVSKQKAEHGLCLFYRLYNETLNIFEKELKTMKNPNMIPEENQVPEFVTLEESLASSKLAQLKGGAITTAKATGLIIGGAAALFTASALIYAGANAGCNIGRNLFAPKSPVPMDQPEPENIEE